MKILLIVSLILISFNLSAQEGRRTLNQEKGSGIIEALFAPFFILSALKGDKKEDKKEKKKEDKKAEKKQENKNSNKNKKIHAEQSDKNKKKKS